MGLQFVLHPDGWNTIVCCYIVTRFTISHKQAHVTVTVTVTISVTQHHGQPWEVQPSLRLDVMISSSSFLPSDCSVQCTVCSLVCRVQFIVFIVQCVAYLDVNDAHWNIHFSFSIFVELGTEKKLWGAETFDKEHMFRTIGSGLLDQKH